MAKVIMNQLPILFGVATVENFSTRLEIHVIPVEEIEQVEIELLQLAKANIPVLKFEQIDVLVVDEIGKNISGDGMDRM